MKRIFYLLHRYLVFTARVLLLGMQHLLEGSWSSSPQETAQTDQA